MCGIFGIIQPRPFDLGEINAFSRVLRHRGPDDEGFLFARGSQCLPFGGEDTPEEALTGTGFLPSRRLSPEVEVPEGGVVLAQRRLSIIDLSPGGHQPMGYQGRYWIVFNGEVFNYKDLREELKTAGYAFHSESDTEVVLAAYDQWGAGCLSRMNGMWAMVIYDSLKETLFLARDRFGVKPLYFHAGEGRLAFASEIKGFTALADWKPKGDRDRILDYLVWGVTDQSAGTLFQGVTQLQPGHCLTLDLPELLGDLQAGKQLDLRPQRWYQPGAPVFASEAEARETLKDLLLDAVRIRLRADVPVGSCLSGGIDSSSIVCLMQAILDSQGVQGRQKTFTARSASMELDETRFAKLVARKTGVLDHYVTPEPDQLFQDLEDLVWTQDQPFVSTSIFAQWCVFRLANSADIRVMLDGQGADEILCGYRGFFGAYLAELAKDGRWLQLGEEIGALKREIGFSRLRSLGYLAAYTFPSLIGWFGKLDGRAFADKAWVTPSARAAFDADPIRSAGGRASSVRGMSEAQIAATNLPMLLRYEDRNSMAFSIEARTPFLDYRVVEASLAMPASYKVGGGLSKGILRRAMQDLVPDEILERRDKLGFVTAEKDWFQSHMKATFRKSLEMSIERFPDLIAPAILERFDAATAGQGSFDTRYWRAINLGFWARRFGI